MTTASVRALHIQQVLTPRRLRVAAVFSAVTLVAVTGAFIASASAHTSTPAASSTKGVVYLGAEAPAQAATVPAAQEVHIANNGLMLVRGAQVVSISDNQMQIHLSWGSSDFDWKVMTTMNTKFFNAQGQPMALADIQVGDIVSITGPLVSGGNNATIQAQFVHE